MRPKSLTQAEIEKFSNFDWNDSNDEENLDEGDDNKSVQLVSQVVSQRQEVYNYTSLC